ncbi:MAG TPA: patatin-like phospholipase family protein [Longimicrobiaceae bacterium]|jgi:NTE family protein|nr:patatin-like phospholipase family protein [Longimicrobiaceae bacterium]
MAKPLPFPAPVPTPDYGDLALVLTGGGARAAYQVGVLRYLAERYPELRLPVLTGVSAGAVNAAHLAQHSGTLTQAVAELAALWTALTPERVFRVDAPSLAMNVVRWAGRLVSGGLHDGKPHSRGLVDTQPLARFLREALSQHGGELTGIEHNLRRGTLKAIALSTTSYTTGQSVIWVQGREIETWQRPNRRSVQTKLRVEHVMASAALPLFFPAVRIGNAWYGDGGIRLTAPLSPALHLGASRVLAVSTRAARSQREADRHVIAGYPPPAQVLGVLYNAIFLDLIDQDVLRFERMNRVLSKMPPEEREGMRVVELLVIRPSRDLAEIARDYEPRLPGAFRYLTRGLGTRQTSSPDLISLLMFQDDYLRRLIELGEADAYARADEIDGFLSRAGAQAAAQEGTG